MAGKKKKKVASRQRKRVATRTGWNKCKYVATRGSKTVANRLATELKKDCYRPLVQAPNAAHEGYTVLSCGKLADCSKPRKRKRKR